MKWIKLKRDEKGNLTPEQVMELRSIDRKALAYMCIEKRTGKLKTTKNWTILNNLCHADETDFYCVVEYPEDNTQKVYNLSKYRPFENKEEFVREQAKHGMYISIKDGVEDLGCVLPLGIDNNGVFFYSDAAGMKHFAYNELLVLDDVCKITWFDGFPCGIKK